MRRWLRDKQSHSGFVVLIAASLVSAVLGSIHAFSVFLEPLETQFAVTRSTASLTYSFALVSLTIAVLLGPKVFSRWSAATFILFASILATCGALLAGFGTSLMMVWFGYSLIFGIANGLGYGFGLQIAAQVNPGREGWAMGVVTASYALGAVVSPALFDLAVISSGFKMAMMALAAVLLFVGFTSAGLMNSAGARFRAEGARTTGTSVPARSQQLLWFGYFGGVVAGLMIIGHAAGIATSLRPEMAAWIAPVIIAGCNLLGSLVAGRLVDDVPLGVVLGSLALLTTIALLGLAVFGGTFGLILCLGLVGFAYGGTIAAYPAAIAKLFGIEQSARIYGRVFTAWGGAGLVGPWFAGFLFDWSGGYQTAFFTAAAFGLISLVVVTVLFRDVRLKAG